MNKAVTGLLLLICSSALTAGPQEVVPGSVQIEDADTLLIEVAGVSYRIQLPDIDAPENTMNPKLQRDIERTGLDVEALLALGRRADEGLSDLLRDFAPYQLHFDPDSRDRYGRVPGELVNTAGQQLSLRLVEEGYAVPVINTNPLRRAALDAAVSAARAGGRGLWGTQSDNFARWAQPAEATAK
ncbi:MAG: thermonuclease family protein [Sedimenticolaceae bacterium]